MPTSLSRRLLLQSAATAWFASLARAASAQRAIDQRKACILLWLDGGPTHLDTFDPKPDASADVRGDFQSIPTAVPDIRLSEKFPQLAAQLRHIALIRSLTTQTNDHLDARVLLHTSYRPTAGGTRHPLLGSVVSAELGDPAATIPNFVVCGTPRSVGGSTYLSDPGYLGPTHTPLIVTDSAAGVANLQPRVPAEEFAARREMLEELNAAYVRNRPTAAVAAHRTSYQRAFRMMSSDQRQAFDISREPEAQAKRYGDSDVGRSCLLARRLVETQVPFVEVYSRDWDNHDAAATTTLKNQTMPAVDQALATLIDDLRERGLFDSTLVVCMGEFGRTPRVNSSGGRDHFSTAFSALLAGAGVKGGQVVGRTSADGSAVVDRPVTVVDLLATIYAAIGVDYQKQRTVPSGRQFAPVDLLTQKEPKPLDELLPRG